MYSYIGLLYNSKMYQLLLHTTIWINLIVNDEQKKLKIKKNLQHDSFIWNDVRTDSSMVIDEIIGATSGEGIAWVETQKALSGMLELFYSLTQEVFHMGVYVCMYMCVE